MHDYLQRGIEKLARKLDVEFNYTVANHNFELGLPRENALKQFFRPYFPTRYAFGSGYLVDIDSKPSNQCEWIIYDATHFAPLLAKAHIEDGVEYFPFDAAFATVEVKSTLSESVLDTALKQVAKTKALMRSKASPTNIHPLLNLKSLFHGDFQSIWTNYFYSGIYAYTEDGIPSAADLISQLSTLDFESLPDFVAVHGKYYVCKVQNLSAPDVGDNYFRLTSLPQQYNAFAAIDAGEMTSAVFAVRMLDQLHNTSLNGYEYMQSTRRVASQFELKNCELADGCRKHVYDKPVGASTAG